MLLLLNQHLQSLAIRRRDFTNPDALLYQRRNELQMVEI
jgi:hypothetical protein